MAKELMTAELRSMVGRTWPPVTYEVERTGIRMWARAVGIDDPLFHDEAVARQRGYERLPAPPGFFGFPRILAADHEPGPPIRGLHPELARSLNAGTEFEFKTPALAGDELVATTAIVNITERVSSSIGRMLLITRETTFDRRGETVALMRATVINY